jgi:hypothetical protein
MDTGKERERLEREREREREAGEKCHLSLFFQLCPKTFAPARAVSTARQSENRD